MPQLSPLPWLIFMVISFIPLLFEFLVSEVVSSEIKYEGLKGLKFLNFKW